MKRALRKFLATIQVLYTYFHFQVAKHGSQDFSKFHNMIMIKLQQ